MKKVIRYGALVLILYVVFLLVLLPADRLYAVLKEKVALPASLYQINGSVWDGRAAVVMVGNHRLESFAWQFEPLALLMGRLQIALDFNKNAGKLSVVIGRSVWGDYYLHDADAALPAADLESFFSRTRLGLSGNVTANLRELKVKGNQLSAVEGTLLWKDAGLTSSADNTTVGSFEINFETTEEGVKGILKDAGGPLQADGIVLLKEDGTYQVTAAFTPRDATRNDIKQALRFLGNPDSSGKVSVSQSGNLQLEKYLSFIAKT